MISGKLIAFDTETTGLNDWHGDKPFAFSFANNNGDVRYCEFRVNPWTRKVICDKKALKRIRKVLEDPNVTKVMHNAKFDVRMMELGWGIKVKGRIHDTVFMAHCVNSLEPSYGLKQLSDRYLDYSKEDQDELKAATRIARNKGKKLDWKLGCKLKMDSVTQEMKEEAQVETDYWMPGELAHRYKEYRSWKGLCERYAKQDAERTLLLYHFYLEAFEDLEGARLAYEDEMKLWPLTYRIESRGVRVDPKVIKQEIHRLTKLSVTHYKDVERVAWKGFNIRSPRDIALLVTDTLKLPIEERTKTGQVKTTHEVLGKHVSNPTVLSLFKFRAAISGLGFLHRYNQLRLIDSLPGSTCSVLHPHYNQVGPATRRFSCREPNLQNTADTIIRTRYGEPVRVRLCFRPRKGFNWYHYDYRQLEIIIFAHCAQEPTMLEALRRGRDLHAECADKAWGGKDNPAAIRTATAALNLIRLDREVTPELQKTWASYGLKSKKQVKSLSENSRIEICEDWLGNHDWSIVKAETTLGLRASRQKAKLVLFAKIFGGGPKVVKDLLLLETVAESYEFLTDYSRVFPRIDEYSREISNKAKRDGYIINLFGHRISVQADKAYRAVNYTVQGSAAALLKDAMVRCDKYLMGAGVDGHLILTIHDEIVFEIHKKWAGAGILLELKRIMEDHGGRLCVDIIVDIDRVTTSWDKKTAVGGLGKLDVMKK